MRSKSGVGDTNVETLYYLAIASARKSLDLTAAYFVPRPAFTDALADAAERGVEVRILVPGPHIDKGFVRVAGRDSYAQLLEAGVRLFEFSPTMLHAKSLVIDGCWSSVGTVNFDNRSFQLHDEVMLGVWDSHFADLLAEQFERDIRRSDEITEERWENRGLRMTSRRGVYASVSPRDCSSPYPRCPPVRKPPWKKTEPERRLDWLLARVRTRRAPPREAGNHGCARRRRPGVLRFLRTKAPHDPATEAVGKGLGMIGESRRGVGRDRGHGRGHRSRAARSAG